MAVNTVAVVVAMITLFLLHGGQSQSVNCFNETSCDGTSFSNRDSASCCFGIGYSYNDGSSCQNCSVIGWKSALMPDGSINRAMEFELEERSLAHTFRVGCLKGFIEYAVFNVGPETTSDYDIRPRQLTLFRCNDVNVNVFLQVDNIAMEQDETIPLTLNKTAGDPSLEVFVINVILIDSDVVTLGFNEDDYAETEAKGAFNVVVRQLEPRKTLDSDIVLRLIPVNYTYANNSGFYTGDEIPFDEDVPNRAVGGIDYDDSIVYCTFPAGNDEPTQLVDNRVVIYDDTVDEDRQFFFVLLQVESATHQNRVKLATSITKCNIDDNDDTHLSFEFSSYSVNETGTRTFQINIIKQKENATATENTYELTVQVKSRSSEMVTSLDFIAKIAERKIRPNQEKVMYPVTILEDGVPEEEESFSLSISPIPNEVQWVNGDYVSTIINIIDDDEIPVFGFVNPNVTVSEDIGIYIQDVTVYVPIPLKELSGEFFFLLSSVDISASIPEDYAVTGIGVLGGFNESIRDQSVHISITDDSKLEEDEVFYLSLRHLSPLPSILNPAIATFIIVDNDHARVGLDKTSYTVDKNRGVVEICARVFDPKINCPIDFAFNLTFDTINGSAVSTKDYIGVSTVLMFDRCAIRRCINISIVDDTIPENTEYFTVMIGGMPNLHPNINLSPTKANITIPDNDAIVVGYNKTNYITTEGQNVVLFAVIQPPGTRAIRPFTIEISTSDDTADEGFDYTPVKMHQLEFNTGDMYHSHTITILDDLDCERNPNEQFFSDLVYVSGQMPIKIDPNRATVMIDDFNETECDVIIVGYNKTTYLTTEGQNVVLFAVIQPPGARAPRPFTIAVSTSNNTAVGGSDYTPVMMHQLVFNTGDMYQSHTITILDDLECERNPNEQFFSDLVYVSGQKPINIVPNRATVVIDDFNATECEVIIGIVKTKLTVSEGDAVVVVSVRILNGTLRSNITIQLFTDDDSATSINGADYNQTVRNITFISGLGKGHDINISIPITEDNIAENNEKFIVGLSLIFPSFNVRVDPGRAIVNITDDDKMGVFVNDTLTGDPLMTVPIYADPDVDQESVHTSLCYEIHGKQNKSFNLISDKCTSVNAHYAKAVVIGSNFDGSPPDVPDINVVNTIGIKAAVMVSGSKMCYNIRVGPDNCQVTLNDVDVSTKRQLYGISIHEFNNRVRIAVPNCGKTTLVMWIFCMDGTTEDLNTNQVFPFRMMRFVVMRGLNLAPTSHGLIGQFWNVPVSVTEFDGDFGGTNRSDDYLIRLSDPNSNNERSFVGIKADITWEFEKRPCLYVGNSQGGPIDEVESPNESVIEGDYTEYEVGSLFATAFRYGQFNETECIYSSDMVA